MTSYRTTIRQMTSFVPKMLADSDGRIQHINSSYLAHYRLNYSGIPEFMGKRFMLQQLKQRKIFENLWSESRVYKKQQLWRLSGRYQTLIWRPGGAVQNLDSLGLSGRVDSTAFRKKDQNRSRHVDIIARKRTLTGNDPSNKNGSKSTNLKLQTMTF